MILLKGLDVAIRCDTSTANMNTAQTQNPILIFFESYLLKESYQNLFVSYIQGRPINLNQFNFVQFFVRVFFGRLFKISLKSDFITMFLSSSLSWTRHLHTTVKSLSMRNLMALICLMKHFT